MGSNRKKKTTFAKLNREQRLRERRIDKEARKQARRAISTRGGDTETWPPQDTEPEAL